MHISSEYFKTCMSLSLSVYSQHMHNTMYMCTSFKMSSCTRNDLYQCPYVLVTSDLISTLTKLPAVFLSYWGCGN